MDVIHNVMMYSYQPILASVLIQLLCSCKYSFLKNPNLGMIVAETV